MFIIQPVWKMFIIQTGFEKSLLFRPDWKMFIDQTIWKMFIIQPVWKMFIIQTRFEKCSLFWPNLKNVYYSACLENVYYSDRIWKCSLFRPDLKNVYYSDRILKMFIDQTIWKMFIIQTGFEKCSLFGLKYVYYSACFRVAKCHRYGRYICVKILKSWGKKCVRIENE